MTDLIDPSGTCPECSKLPERCWLPPEMCSHPSRRTASAGRPYETEDGMRERWDDGMPEEEKERRRERARQWKKANRERAEASNKAYRQRHRDRQNARGAVTVALREGVLTKGPCEACGSSLVEAHHDDYAKRLEVRWLCRVHHVEADVTRRRAS